MTRYTKYKKTYNATTIDGEKTLTEAEREQIEQDKQQSLEDLRNSKNLRSKPVCLKCRKRGHSVKFCPQGTESICYNCGSRDHTLKFCRQPRGAELKFANCFICKHTGHLASACAQNERGIYPKGGGCRFCGSKVHLARDCRPTREADAGTFVGASSDPRKENPDEDLVFSALKNIEDEREERKKQRKSTNDASSSKKTKVVKF